MTDQKVVMPNEIRGLSIRQPWAWGICANVKRTENRTWSTDRRGTIAIHASTSKQVVNALGRELGCSAMAPDSFTFGAIIGLAEVVDVASYGPQHENDPFAEGPCCWTMANGRFLKEPIPLKGKLNLFKIPPEVELQLRSAETVEVRLAENARATAIAEAMTGMPDPVASYLELLDEYDRNQQHFHAVAVAGERLIALAPDQPAGYMVLGAMRLADPDADDCVSLLRRSVEIDPDFFQGWYYLSQAQLRDSQPEMALTSAERLMHLDPASPAAYEARARAHFHLGRFNDSIADADASLRLSPENVVVLTLRAEAKASAGDRDGATSDLADAMRLCPGNAAIEELKRRILRD